MQELRLGIDVASVEHHRAALADETGRLIWSNRRFVTTSSRNGPAKQGVASAPSTGPFSYQTRNQCKGA